jgi:hypothetical protein
MITADSSFIPIVEVLMPWAESDLTMPASDGCHTVTASRSVWFRPDKFR